MTTLAPTPAADLRTPGCKHALPSNDKLGANKKARTGNAAGKAVASASTSSTPAAAPSAPGAMLWTSPAAPTVGTSDCPGASAPAQPSPSIVPPMPFFMPPGMPPMPMGMMPPPMMAMQACMMMQMQMQAMQSMMQQQQQQVASDQQQAPGVASKPTPAAAAAASLGYPGPLPCYPAFPFMPMAPPMCFPPMAAGPMPIPISMPALQPQAACSASNQQQQSVAPATSVAPASSQQQTTTTCSAATVPSPVLASAVSKPQQRQQQQQFLAPVVPVDATAASLSDKDFAAFIDSFVSDGTDQLLDTCLPTITSVSESKQQELPEPMLIALGGGDHSGRVSSGGSDSADDDFSFCLDDLLPLDVVTSQVESSLKSFDSMHSSADAFNPCAETVELSLHDGEEGGEESDLIFGLGAQVDGLLPAC